MTNVSMRRPTLRHVAQAAGVSIKTASRVVNGEDGVSAEFVSRVERAIASLHYLPDERARNLRRSESKPTSIAFALSDVSNPFFSAVLRGLEDVARPHGCLVLSASSDSDSARERQLIDMFLQRRVGGVVAVPSTGDGAPFSIESFRDIPLVFLDCEPDEHDRDVVRTDHFGGARAMTRVLIENGHRCIAFAGDDPSIFSARLRYDGFLAEMAANRLPVDDRLVIRQAATPEVWQRTLFGWLQHLGARGPTAIITAQNFATTGAVRALRDLKWHERIALIGFDDVEMGDMVEPPISVLAQQPHQLGRLAGELLFERIADPNKPPTRLIIDGTLICRGSGELAPPKPST